MVCSLQSLRRSWLRRVAAAAGAASSCFLGAAGGGRGFGMVVLARGAPGGWLAGLAAAGFSAAIPSCHPRPARNARATKGFMVFIDSSRDKGLFGTGKINFRITGKKENRTGEKKPRPVGRGL